MFKSGGVVQLTVWWRSGVDWERHPSKRCCLRRLRRTCRSSGDEIGEQRFLLPNLPLTVSVAVVAVAIPAEDRRGCVDVACGRAAGDGNSVLV